MFPESGFKFVSLGLSGLVYADVDRGHLDQEALKFS